MVGIHSVLPPLKKSKENWNFIFFTIYLKAENGKRKHLEEIRRNHIIEHLKIEEAQQNSKRIESLRDEKKRRILDKIDADGKRIAEIQNSKDDAFQERKRIEILLQEEK